MNAGSDSDCHLTLWEGCMMHKAVPQPCHWMTFQTLKICHFLTLNLSIQWQKEKGEQFMGAECLVAMLQRAICGLVVPNCGILRVCE